MLKPTPEQHSGADQLVTLAQKLLDENQYLTLATADAKGRPWSSTVWYTALLRLQSPERLAAELIWLSRPAAQHSRNLLQYPEVGISIFNSTQPAGTGEGLQFSARAERVPSADVDEAAAAFSKASLAAGGGAWTRAQVEEPAGPASTSRGSNGRSCSAMARGSNFASLEPRSGGGGERPGNRP